MEAESEGVGDDGNGLRQLSIVGTQGSILMVQRSSTCREKVRNKNQLK